MERLQFDISSVTRINWLGITILEPVTVLTNLLITAVCLFAFFKLGKKQNQETITSHYRYFFLLMGISTAVGGILGHGFLYATGMYGKLPGWYISMLAIAFIERAAILHAKPLMPSYWGNFFSTLNYLEVTAFFLLAFKTLNFRFIEAHATYGLFGVVFFLELYLYQKKNDPGSRYIFAGTALAAAAAFTHLFKISFSQWFNYNDISHVIMATGVYCYYLGASKIKVYQAETQIQPSQNKALQHANCY